MHAGVNDAVLPVPPGCLQLLAPWTGEMGFCVGIPASPASHRSAAMLAAVPGGARRRQERAQETLGWAAGKGRTDGS